MHDKHLRNAALAKATGVHVTTVSQWLNDKFEPDPSNLETLANLLGVSVGWLRFGEVSGAATTGGAAATTQGAGTVSVPGYVLIPAVEAAYHRGVLDAGIRTIGNVMLSLDAHAESLRALRGLLSGTTAGLSGIVDAGVLPGPGPTAQPVTPTTTPEEAAALVEHYRQIGAAERERRERAAGERETPRRKRGVGS